MKLYFEGKELRTFIFLLGVFFTFSVAISQDLIIPPELYWYTNELTKEMPNNKIILSKDPITYLDYDKSIGNISKYILPIFTRWNYSATKACSIRNGYVAKKIENKYQLTDKYNDEDPIGMIVFDKNYFQIYYEGNGTSCFLIEAYWLTDNILVAIGQCPSYVKSEENKVKIFFFYKYEFMDKNIKRTEYEYEQSYFGENVPNYNYWIELRSDYFIDPPFRKAN